MKLRDKKVLLTGASGGIGKAIVSSLANQGASLVLVGRDVAALQKLKISLADSGVLIDVMSLDLGSDQVMEQTQVVLARHPDIDVLINGAGVNQFSACDALSADQLSKLIDINLKGTLLLTTAMLPALKQRPEAAIVNVGSTFGSIGYPGFAAYCASKFGVRGYSEALRRELADTKVSVFYVAPRATKTAMNEQAVTEMNKALGVAMDEPEWVADQLVQAIEKGRLKLFLGWPEKLFVIINGVFSNLVDKALIKQLPTVQHYLKRKAI